MSTLNDKFDKYENESLNTIIKNNIPTVDELERQWNEFNSMIKSKRLESDEMSIMLTGMTNQQRYEIQLKSLISESSESDINNSNKIDMAKQWIVDSNIYMIYPDKNIDDLFNNYLAQPYDLQKDADEMCTQLFGCNNRELYNIIKSSEKTISNIDSLSDYELNEKLIKLENSNINNNLLDYHYNEYAKQKIINELKCRYDTMNRIKWIHSMSPYFTPDESRDLKGFYSESSNDVCDKIFSEYDKCYNGFTNTFDPVQWDDVVRKIFYLLEYEKDHDKINQYKQQLVDIGWNPEIPYNIENCVKAKQRLETCLNQYYNGIEIIDIEGAFNSFTPDNEEVITEKVKDGYYPIHIILVRGDSPLSAIITKLDRGPFSHSALCLDNDFTRLYSFNINAKNKITSSNKGGLSLETIKGYPLDNRLAIYTFFVTKEQYDVLNHNVQQMLWHTNETEYSVLNLFTILFKDINLNFNTKLICSQFVDKMLKLANIDITNTPSDKVSPNTFYKISIGNSKIYKTYDGTVKDFDFVKAQKFVEKMSTKAKFINESTEWGPCPFLDNYEIPYITEAKPIIRFNKEGDVLLDTPHVFIDLEQEYYNSHKLLVQYEKSNNYEGMKYELCRLYYMIHLVEKRIYGDRNLAINKSKDELIKTRAKILNDFNKYMKMLLKNQPKFNFGEYYEHSRFYPHTLELDKNTIKFTAKILKDLIR